jgi:hypothetical protein
LCRVSFHLLLLFFFNVSMLIKKSRYACACKTRFFEKLYGYYRAERFFWCLLFFSFLFHFLSFSLSLVCRMYAFDFMSKLKDTGTCMYLCLFIRRFFFVLYVCCYRLEYLCIYEKNSDQWSRRLRKHRRTSTKNKNGAVRNKFMKKV